MTSFRSSERALILVFLLLIGGVPVAQVIHELARGERAQFTDVFRRPPTAMNLRQFEHTLEDQSWFERRLRPLTQTILFRALGETGGSVVSGRSDWLFYRPDLRHLVEPDRPEALAPTSRWMPPQDGVTGREHAARAVVRFRDQLRARGIRLLVVPVPGKASVYPERVTRRWAGRAGDFRSPTEAWMDRLGREGVEVVNLFETFRERRADAGAADEPLYLAQDTHWTPPGAALGARAVAHRLAATGVTATERIGFRRQTVSVARWGDLVEMMQTPGGRAVFGAETVRCEQVLDPDLGLLVPTPSDRPGCYRYPVRTSSVLVLGDSFCRIYQFAEPRSLGEVSTTEAPESGTGTRRLLPGSAGFISQLALSLGAPVDAIVSDGGAATDVRQRLSTNPEILEGKRVVVWVFAEREISLGRAGWRDVPLPIALADGTVPANPMHLVSD